ncbi:MULTISPECIES: bifunctional pyr operon transcriptional regulator/uracil phosphoribosyltransferase PyrR [Dethiosulfovibrio]|uniref:bifunctional pyr operon transcriptional regulator/uracil phosphoribosyltransferase PyrR n=1 Tax=Dethiosulfovibrio TaxID=47054 RepID=UPI002B0FF012|nr:MULTISPECIES: bifunctional pyr operon transcriptional regulator/uracil phosphoribosyltransferase PyrR [Dethiosulfovibrio]MEA3284241.1 bifunctional pyr operon transcriptional regulator/uracil phosphoribosyltransferase PyrR [Synergistota bacterium]
MKLREKAVVMTAEDMERVLRRIANEIIERNRGLQDLVILGIQRRGVYLASRIRKILLESEGVKLPKGELDITLYRDDLAVLSDEPIVHSTSIPVDVSGKTLVLVDDVLFTGRTIRAALEALMDLGRPGAVQLAILVDRGHRELPIQPDFLGKTVPTSKSEVVEVRVEELDGEDRVLICEREDLS